MELGTKLFKYLSFRGIQEYEVIGIDGEYLLIKSLFCNSNKKCVVRINIEEGFKHRYKFVSLMESCGADTYEDKDGEIVDNNHMWHTGSPFFESKSECKKYQGKSMLDSYNKDIKKYQEQIKEIEKKIEYSTTKLNEIKTWMES